jgi:TPR repeat protein
LDPNRFQDVFNEIASGRLTQARNLLKPLVKSTPADPAALFLLGRVRWEGRDTVAANEEAFKCFKEAARLGSLYGKFYAAVAYFNGIGVRQNRKTGIRWFEDCAGRGCAGAMQQLASLYLESNGVEYDIEKAIAYLSNAANQPGIPYRGRPVTFAYCTSVDEFIELNEAEAIANAQEYLAYLYSGEEVDVPRDADMAARWAAKAVANGFSELIWPLIDLYLELGKQGEAKVLLLELVRKHDPRAMHELARIYEKSGSKEEQDQVYRLDMEARKGGYAHTQNLPVPFQKPEKTSFGSFDFFDEDAWPDLLAQAHQCRIDDPHALKIKVRIYRGLAISECEEARCRLQELIADIGELKYLELVR